MEAYARYYNSVTAWILKLIVSLQRDNSNRSRYKMLYNFPGTYTYRMKAPLRKTVYWLGMILHRAEFRY